MNTSFINTALKNFCSLSQSSDFNNDLLSLSNDFLDFIPIYTLYTNIALNISKVIFPQENTQLNGDFNEKLLFYKGKSAIVRDKSKGFILCDCSTINSHFNMFGEPTKINAFDVYTGENIGQYTEDDFVIIKNNPLMVPTNLTVLKAAIDLTEIMQASVENVKQQKFPVVFQGTNQQKLTFEKLIENLEKKYPYIFLDKEINVDDITKLMIDAKFISKELLDLFERRKSMLMESLGVANVGVMKQSGISDDEINSNNILTDMSADLSISCKKNAIKELKNKFNLSATLWVNPIISKGVEENEPIYNFTE